MKGLLNSTLTMLCLTTPDKAVLLFVSHSLQSFEVIFSRYNLALLQGVTDCVIVLGFALGPLIAGGLYTVNILAVNHFPC